MQRWEYCGYTVTKVNFKYKISGLILNRWNKLGGVKLFSSKPIKRAANTFIKMLNNLVLQKKDGSYISRSCYELKNMIDFFK